MKSWVEKTNQPTPLYIKFPHARQYKKARAGDSYDHATSGIQEIPGQDSAQKLQVKTVQSRFKEPYDHTVLKHFLACTSISHSIALAFLFANNLQDLYMLAIVFPSLMPLTSTAFSTSQIWGNGSLVDDNSSVWHCTRSGWLVLPEGLFNRAQTEPTYFRYNGYLWGHGSSKITFSLQASA